MARGRIVYWGHSGFSVQTARRLLIFDYTGGGMTPPTAAERAAIFVSHAHGDHFLPAALAWPGMHYAGEDLPETVCARRMRPGERVTEDGLTVAAYPSTDQGVSFFAEADGLRIFHAGDLNFWHWRAESDAAEVAAAEAAFEAALDALDGLPMDAAFFPVDPRMGAGYEEGALRFARRLRPRLLIPMHWWGDAAAAAAFARLPMPDGVRALALTRPGQEAQIEGTNTGGTHE